MRIVVHRIDAPGVAGPMMRLMPDAIENRIAHIDVRRGHVDLRTQDMSAVRKLPFPHAAKQIEILLDAAIAMWRFLPRFRQRAAVSADLFGRKAVDICLPGLNQMFRPLVELLEVIRSVIE